MGNDFREKFGSVAKSLGFDTKSKSDSNNAEQSLENKDQQEIKVGSLVRFKNGKNVSVFKLPGGASAGFGMSNFMGYKDADSGFIVVNIEPDGQKGMVEIKPAKYSYKTDEGKTYLTTLENLNVIPESTTTSY